MPRARRAARAYRRPRSTVHVAVKARLSDEWEMFELQRQPERFHKLLQTPAERAAFAELFPTEFYALMGCETSVLDQYPASIEVAQNAIVFRRPNFAEFIRDHPPVVALEMPALAAVPFRERHFVMAGERALWFLHNRWPITPREARWISQNGTDEARELLLRHSSERIPEIEVGSFSWEAASVERRERNSRRTRV